MTAAPAHSKLGASSMHRWSACPGSVREAAKAPPRLASVYAEEGTDAHAYAAMCLTRRSRSTKAEDAGRTFTFDGRTFTIAEDMPDAVGEYVGYIAGLLKKHPDAVLSVEQRFDLSAIHTGCFGTADAVLWVPSIATLIVADYKHGAGIPVAVEGNPQLQYYGLGALLQSKYPAKKVRLVVVQPRCENADGAIREWEIDAIDLVDFAADLKAYAEATEKPDAPLVPGDHCRFCPASGVCPALSARALEAAKLDFTPVPPGGTALPVPYDPETLRLALDSREIVKTWLKAVDEFAYAEAEAGRCPPGYKLVAKRATRKWREDGPVIEHLQGAGFKDDAIFEPRRLKSPAQMEKLVKKGALDAFVVAESSGSVLVPESDKRPAVKVSAADDFRPIADHDDLLRIPEFLRRNAA